MKHNKWFVACLICLVATAIPGGMNIMWGVLACVGCAGGCFLKWMYEEDKYQKRVDKCGKVCYTIIVPREQTPKTKRKKLKKSFKKGLTNETKHDIIRM